MENGNKGKDLRQMLENKKLQQKETIPGCTTWSPNPRKLKKKAFQDTTLVPLEENIFYHLTQKEGRKYGRMHLSSIIVGPTPRPLKVHAKHAKKRQYYFPVNNATKLAQFKDLLKKKGGSEVDILTLPVHHSEEVNPITDHSIPMVVKRNDKKKGLV